MLIYFSLRPTRAFSLCASFVQFVVLISFCANVFISCCGVSHIAQTLLIFFLCFKTTCDFYFYDFFSSSYIRTLLLVFFLCTQLGHNLCILLCWYFALHSRFSFLGFFLCTHLCISRVKFRWDCHLSFIFHFSRVPFERNTDLWHLKMHTVYLVPLIGCYLLFIFLNRPITDNLTIALIFLS